MTVDPVTILLGLVFLTVLLLVEGLFYLIRDIRGTDQAINRRMRMLAAGESSERVLLRLRRGDNRKRIFAAIPGFFRIDRLLTQAGMLISTGRFVTLCILFSAIVLLLMRLFPVLPFIASVPVAVAVGFSLPLLLIAQRRRSRVKRFNEQLPESVDIVVRSLRAGHPVSVALKMVSKELTDPAGSEFGILVDEMTYGLELRDGLANMSERMPLPDLYYVIVAINVQYGTGGNLAEVLDGLSRVIRDRFHMFRKIKAVSAEGRLSATILTVLPFFVVFMMMIVSPRYFGEVRDDPLLPVMIGIGMTMLMIGIAVMWKMVRIRV
jgi:tight adherence protein B